MFEGDIHKWCGLVDYGNDPKASWTRMFVRTFEQPQLEGLGENRMSGRRYAILGWKEGRKSGTARVMR